MAKPSQGRALLWAPGSAEFSPQQWELSGAQEGQGWWCTQPQLCHTATESPGLTLLPQAWLFTLGWTVQLLCCLRRSWNIKLKQNGGQESSQWFASAGVSHPELVWRETPGAAGCGQGIEPHLCLALLNIVSPLKGFALVIRVTNTPSLHPGGAPAPGRCLCLQEERPHPLTCSENTNPPSASGYLQFPSGHTWTSDIKVKGLFSCYKSPEAPVPPALCTGKAFSIMATALPSCLDGRTPHPCPEIHAAPQLNYSSRPSGMFLKMPVCLEHPGRDYPEASLSLIG